MRWQELTWPRFGKAVKQVGGVCVLPVGVVAPQGAHLPLGSDYLGLDLIAARAAEIEPAIVFPPYCFGSASAARHRPGTIALKRKVMLELLDRVVSEVARNGLKKIILVSRYWLVAGVGVHDFVQATMHRERDYAVYMVGPAQLSPGNDPAWQKMKSTQGWSFGGEEQTSLMLAARPDLVRMDEIRGDGAPRRQMGHLAGAEVAVQPYADHPDLYAGNARAATAEKGRFLLDYAVARLAEAIAAVKADTKAAEYLPRYYAGMADPMRAKE